MSPAIEWASAPPRLRLIIPRMAKKAASPTQPGPDTRILILCGPDPMLKAEALDRLKQALAEAHGEYEVHAFDGRSSPLADVLDELRTYSLLQRHKLVLVDEADAFVRSHRDALERYAAHPVDQGTLVLRSVNWNSPKLDALVAKVGMKIKADPLSPADAKAWAIHRALANHQRKLPPPVAQALIERLGADLLRIDTELAKLAILTQPEQPITLALVEEMVGRTSDEKAWAVQEALIQALASREAHLGGGAAIEKLHELVDLAGHPETLVAYFVADLMRKLRLAWALKQQGHSDSDITRQLKVWPFERQRPFMALVARLGDTGTRRLFDAAVDCDLRAKTGLGDPLRNLECFFASLTDSVRA